MFTWPNILLAIMAVFLGVASSLALGRLIKNKLHDRRADQELEETFRREKLQADLNQGGPDAGRRS